MRLNRSRLPKHYRRGHMEFLLLLMILGTICAAVQILLLEGPCKNWSILGKVFILQFNPAVLMFEAIVFLWTPFLALFVLEGGASHIGIAVWQYDKESVLGVPKWFIQRACLLALGLTLAAASLAVSGFTVDHPLSASMLQIQIMGLISFFWIWSITWVLALRKSKGDFDPIIGSCFPMGETS